MWRAVLPAANGSLHGSTRIEALEQRLRQGLQGQDNYIQSNSIIKAFSIWIEEALALPAAGMPLKSFSLVFDSHPVPDRSIEIFQVALTDAELQSAIQKYCQQRQLSMKLIDLHGQRLVPLEGLWRSGEIFEDNTGQMIELPSWSDFQMDLLVPKDEYDVVVAKERQAEDRSRKLAKERSMKQAKGKSRELAKGRSQKASYRFQDF